MITLFEHNQTAYEAAVSMLHETGKAAVIHPTGTGKSFIGFKLCEDFSDKTVCWLSPSEYIFKTQLENLRASGADVPQNIKFYTYAKLMNMTDEELADIQPELAVYDEFHCAGAALWSVGIWRLRDMYPNIPTLGLSATAIRYLDNQRDMAYELFDGNIASEMTLTELGMVCDSSYTVRWEKGFSEAVCYREANGHLRVPAKYSVKGICLNKWVNEQKQAYRGNRKQRLTAEQVRRLEGIGMVWDKRSGGRIAVSRDLASAAV